MFGIEKDFQKLMEQVYGPLNGGKMSEIEEVKAEIKVLEKKLSFLEELEKTKSPVEEAYKDWWGAYPGTEIWTNFDETRWVGFKAGYNAAYQEMIAEEQLATQKGNIKTLVEESVKWCEEHPDKDPLDCLKPQTPEQTAQSLKEAFVKAQQTENWKETQKLIDEEDNDKNFKNSLDLIKEWREKNKRKTLSDLIYDWWSDVFTTHSDWDMETSIENLVDEISLWLPTEHETNSYKWNECIRTIREKLR